MFNILDNKTQPEVKTRSAGRPNRNELLPLSLKRHWFVPNRFPSAQSLDDSFYLETFVTTPSVGLPPR